MANIDQKLPPEILSRVFRALSISRKDISACRLTCHLFKRWSSEYLITRVVFANRLDTIQRTLEVVQHPYFHRYVTELVYDASLYCEHAALDFDWYIHLCFESSERDWERRIDEVLHNYEELSYQVCQVATEVDDASTEDEIKDLDEEGFRDGFHDYFQRFRAQSLLVNGRLRKPPLQQILTLPKLSSVMLTGFHKLAAAGENYHRLCTRLFGNTLEPLGLDHPQKVANAFEYLTSIIAETPKANIRSLSVGDDESYRCSNCYDYWDYFPSPDYQIAIPYTWEGFGRPRSETVSKKLLKSVGGNLRQLCLPIAFTYSSDEDGALDIEVCDMTGLHSMLEASAPNLLDLTLLTTTLHPDVNWEIPHDFLADILLSHDFKSLRSLELHGWPLSRGTKWQSWLLKHSSTLRELRLRCCVFVEDPQLVARWAGENMSLDGIVLDIEPYVAYSDARYPEWEDDIHVLETLWLNGRPNSLSGASKYNDCSPR